MLAPGAWLLPVNSLRLQRPPPGSTRADQASVTLTTNDSYAKGTLVLGSSLKQHRTTRKLAVFTALQVSDSTRKVLETVFDEVIMVDIWDSGDSCSSNLNEEASVGCYVY